MLPADDDEVVQRLLERGRVAVSNTPLTGENLEPVGPVTISIGLAIAPRDDRDFERVLNFADAALYRAKGAGRNRVETYSTDAPAAAA